MPSDLTRQLREALLDAAHRVADSTKRSEILAAIERGDLVGAVDSIRFEVAEQELEHVVPQSLRSAYESSLIDAQRALHTRAGLRVAFNVINPKATAWIAENAGALITTFGQSSLESLRDLVINAYQSGTSPAKLADLIVDSGIGLNARQQQSLFSYRAGLEQAGAPNVDDLVADRAERLLVQRAEMIAHTETQFAATQGKLHIWQEAASRGLLDHRATKEWQTTGAENVCDECEALDGEEVALDEAFSNGDDGPPAHPKCACTVVLHVLGKAA